MKIDSSTVVDLVGARLVFKNNILMVGLCFHRNSMLPLVYYARYVETITIHCMYRAVQ